jgi:hypothetical protein
MTLMFAPCILWIQLAYVAFWCAPDPLYGLIIAMMGTDGYCFFASISWLQAHPGAEYSGTINPRAARLDDVALVAEMVALLRLVPSGGHSSVDIVDVEVDVTVTTVEV